MNTNVPYLHRKLEGQHILWFKNSNQYNVLEEFVYEIIDKLLQGVPTKQIEGWLTETSGFSEEICLGTIDYYTKLVKEQNEELFLKNEISSSWSLPSSFYSTKTYQIGQKTFLVRYETLRYEYLVHPKFAHLEVPSTSLPDHQFSVFDSEGKITFTVNGKGIGQWDEEGQHYFQGKFSMELIKRFYQIPEEEWMGVFHASAISDDENCILFMGESGNGKSTLSALLMNEGYHSLADDFVPVCAKNKKVYQFPAAISVKKPSLEVLTPLYKELEQASEYQLAEVDKIIRYLKPRNTLTPDVRALNCKAFVFVKYEKGAELQLEEISKVEAFKKIVPDAWLNPTVEAAQQFLDWCAVMPCYSLVYSENEQMIQTVTQLFSDDE